MKIKAHKDRPDPKPTGGVASLVTADCLVWLKAQPSGSIPVFFFSPPYNKHRGGKASHFSTAWKADLANGYATYSDDMPHVAYVEWMHDVLSECWRVLTDDGAIFFQHKDQQHKGCLLTPDELNPGLPLRQRIIWDRGSGPCANRNFLRPSFEFIHVYAKPKFKFGKAGVITDIIRARPANSDHPAPFPVELPQAIISQLAPHHDTICDIFSGSGSTGVAALAEGRNYIGVELDAGYNAKAAERLNCTVETLSPPAPVERPAVKATLFNQDCLKAMTKLADESVHCSASAPLAQIWGCG